MVIFHSYVSLPEGKFLGKNLREEILELLETCHHEPHHGFVRKWAFKKSSLVVHHAMSLCPSNFWGRPWTFLDNPFGG
jgi:hypothetical protein